MQEIESVIQSEIIKIPVINILEYSDIHLCEFKQAIVVIYKYPIIEKECKLYKIYPLANKLGKLLLDDKIALCENNYQRISKCKNIIGSHICRIESKDHCTITILNNEPAQCKTKLENNSDIEDLGNGNIFIDNEHTLNNLTINGPHLIQFDQNITVDDKTYFNEKNRIYDIIHKRHNEELSILELLYTDSENTFTNIQKISTLFIPLEEHPLKTILYTIFIFAILITVNYYLVQFCKCYTAHQEKKKQELYKQYYEAELLRLQTQV